MNESVLHILSLAINSKKQQQLNISTSITLKIVAVIIYINHISSSVKFTNEQGSAGLVKSLLKNM